MRSNEVAGVVTGLAWTRVGGDILYLLNLFCQKEKVNFPSLVI